MLKFLLSQLFAGLSYALFKLHHAKLHGYLFAFIRKHYPGRYLSVDVFEHPYVVPTSDNGTSRELFRSGQLDLKKNSIALLNCYPRKQPKPGCS